MNVVRRSLAKRTWKNAPPSLIITSSPPGCYRQLVSCRPTRRLCKKRSTSSMNWVTLYTIFNRGVNIRSAWKETFTDHCRGWRPRDFAWCYLPGAQSVRRPWTCLTELVRWKQAEKKRWECEHPGGYLTHDIKTIGSASSHAATPTY